MSGLTRPLRTFFFIAFCFNFSFGQTDVDALRKEQKQLAEKIALANKLLSDNQSRKKDSELQMALIA